MIRKTLSALLLAFAASAGADLSEAVNAALNAEIRTDAERARDRNRMPRQTLEFFGLEQDMHVLELVPGGGWYTKILAPVLRENGKLYLSISAGRVAASLLSEDGFDRVEVIETGEFSRTEGSRRSGIANIDFGIDDVDLALTFRNLHNFTEDGRRAMNQAVFDALAPGGQYGVVDHTRRHMQADSQENWRRMDPVAMIKEIEAIGFEFVDYASLHYRADDELRFEVGRRTVTGNTDRFTLLFRKP